MMCWCVFLLPCLSRGKLTCQSVCVCARLAWGGCSVSTNIHSQSVMQEQATFAVPCPSAIGATRSLWRARVCAVSGVHAVAGWRRVVCLKGCDIKALWSLPLLSSAMSPFICEAHFISLPPFFPPTLCFSPTSFSSPTDATCSPPHSFVSYFITSPPKV